MKIPYTKLHKMVLNELVLNDLKSLGYVNEGIKQVFERESYNRNVKYWAQGLPSAFSFPFYNYDITTNAAEYGILQGKHYKDEYNLIKAYWGALVYIVGYIIKEHPLAGGVSVSKDDFTRINNDVNGNPRYVVWYGNIAHDYGTALYLAKKLGGKKYHNKSYGGGVVFQSYNVGFLANELNEYCNNGFIKDIKL